MSLEQKEEFQKRRNSILRKHIANDPKLRKARRKRKLSVALSVLGSLVTLAVFMVMLKSFVLAIHGPQGYAQMVAPMLERDSAGPLATRALGADPVSAEIAALLRPMLPRRTDLAASAPVQADQARNTPDPVTTEPGT
ncbi:hypothetical protein [Natronohydrobacter thiooxidans]|jgi:hypothetical protein|uniref:hypothetical protein n=1 Tax=Natronohydrobacter thiooxidans TaxID=87172 RepID=UPI0008FF75BD|nr:hypothetical protein [Natronohydrobacter thiooxidans]